MADDPVEEGLEKTRLELEGYAAELERSIPAEGTRETSRRVDDPIGRAAAELLGGVLRIGLHELLSRPRPAIKPRWKFTSRSQAVAAAPPLPPVAAAPAVAPVESGKPDTSPQEPASRARAEEVPTLGLPGLSFVGHFDDRPTAKGSTRFPPPTEPLSAHQPRLDIDDRTPLSRPALRGPVIGSRE